MLNREILKQTVAEACAELQTLNRQLGRGADDLAPATLANAYLEVERLRGRVAKLAKKLGAGD